MRSGGLHPARRATSACGAQPGFLNCGKSHDTCAALTGQGEWRGWGSKTGKMGHPGKAQSRSDERGGGGERGVEQ